MTKKPKLVYSIKGKLVSAVCMLLVAMIMVVSSTYAWFTLSTAPEVTGIQTAVGSNGALEMGLLGLNGTVPGATTTSDGVGSDWTVKNLTWGNLVDLTDGYGLDQIKLYPSVLNKTGDAIASTGILSIPSYDASGRPGTLTPNTFTGTYANNAFKVNNNFGVRAIGASSSMTERQIAYRNYMGDAKDATATATASITQSLKDNGAGLASAAMKIAMNGDNAKFTAADVAMIGSILADLEAARDDVATALLNYIYATVASKVAQTSLTDAVWATVDATMKTKTLDTLVQSKTESETVVYYVSFDITGGDGSTNNVEIQMPASFQAAYAAYIALGTKITNAKAAHQAISPDAGEEYTSDAFSLVLNHLVNTSMVTINGMSMSQAKENILGLVQGGVNVQMPSGSGIFADFADLCGNYSAPVSVDGSELDVGVPVQGKLSATMVTTSNVNPAYLKAVNTEVTAFGSPDRPAIDNSTATDATLNEFYGYIIDLAFRTNASGSFLRLQTEAVDRIYADNANEATMGHGSSMTFSTTDPSFTPDMIAELMSALRIVFFHPETGEIYAEARLDMGYTADADGNITSRNYEINGSEVTGYMYIIVPGMKTEYYVPGTEGAADTILTKVGENYYTSYTDENTNTPYTGDVASILTRQVETGEMTFADQENAKIVDLQQGQAQKVSALVYLDGEVVDNGMVPAQGDMTGSMNLQFSSSVELEPMENGTLHTPGTQNP